MDGCGIEIVVALCHLVNSAVGSDELQIAEVRTLYGEGNLDDGGRGGDVLQGEAYDSLAIGDILQVGHIQCHTIVACLLSTDGGGIHSLIGEQQFGLEGRKAFALLISTVYVKGGLLPHLSSAQTANADKRIALLNDIFVVFVDTRSEHEQCCSKKHAANS